MNFALSLSDIINIQILSILFTLSIYHLFIYLGRGKIDGTYHLNFSIFNLALSIFIFFSVNLKWYVIKTEALDQSLGVIIAGISFFIVFIHLKKVLDRLFDYQPANTRIFIPFYVAIGLFLLINLSILIVSYEFYMNFLYIPIAGLASFSALYLLLVFIVGLYKRKQFKSTIYFIVIISVVFLYIEILLQEVILIYSPASYIFRDIYIITGVNSLLWAYILSYRFNTEYHELNILKANLELRIQERTQELKKAAEQKTNIFINIAHELKTPLTLVNNYLSEYLNKYGTNPEIDIVKSNIARINRDVSNFFDTEKHQKGFMLYNHNQIINFSELLNSLVLLYLTITEQKKIHFEYAIEDHIFIKADPSGIERVIYNLLENAIRYVPVKGNIHLELKTIESKICFSIRDNGPGIPVDMQQFIFDPYFQVSAIKQNNQGMGMGLSIVKRIIDELKGSIKLKSEVGNGTTFFVELTAYPGIDKDANTNHTLTTELVTHNYHGLTDAIRDEKGHSILIIDDNHDLLLYLQDKLKPNYNVYIASNGMLALEKLNHISSPDIIISDIMMDTMDGIEFLKIISENKHFNHIPLIFITAKSNELDKLKGIQLGAIDYIEKPFVFEDLEAKISTIIALGKNQKRRVLDTAFKAISNQMENVPISISTPDYIFNKNCKKYELTIREKEIIQLIGEEINNKEIAKRLFISERTVSKHIQNIYSKVSVKDKTKLLTKIYNGQTTIE